MKLDVEVHFFVWDLSLVSLTTLLSHPGFWTGCAARIDAVAAGVSLCLVFRKRFCVLRVTSSELWPWSFNGRSQASQTRGSSVIFFYKPFISASIVMILWRNSHPLQFTFCPLVFRHFGESRFALAVSKPWTCPLLICFWKNIPHSFPRCADRIQLYWFDCKYHIFQYIPFW